MKKFKKLLVCMLAVMMLISSAIPVSAATRPAIPTLRSAQMTSSGRMSLSWKSVSNANGYKVRIYNCRKKKASSIHLSGRYNNNYYTNKSANTAYLVSVYSYRWVNGQRIYSIDSDAFVCTPRTLTTVSSTASTLTVKWSKLYGISGYYVYKSTSSNSGYKRYALPPAAACTPASCPSPCRIRRAAACTSTCPFTWMAATCLRATLPRTALQAALWPACWPTAGS